MFSSIKRFSSILAAAVVVCLSVAAGCITQAVSIVTASVSSAFDVFTRIVVRVASHLPSLATKRPTGTAAERQHMIPSTTYARTQDARRRPTVEPGWRMCASV